MSYWAPIGQRVYELCQKHGLSDRMPRHIPPGPRATNRRLAEYLADKTYRLELAQEPAYRLWSYRKAWWALDDLEENVRRIYERRGEKGLIAIKGVGKKLASEIAQWLEENEDKPGEEAARKLGYGIISKKPRHLHSDQQPFAWPYRPGREGKR